MGAFIAKQPNGLYCRFSSVVDCPTSCNMTEEDYIELCKRKAEEDARDVLKNHLKPFEWVEAHFRPNNMTRKEFNDFLKETAQTPGETQAKNCKVCGTKMIWAHPDIPGRFMESSCYLGDDWPICHDCMVDHCVHANCLGCNYGKYPGCRFLEMKTHYMNKDD